MRASSIHVRNLELDVLLPGQTYRIDGYPRSSADGGPDEVAERVIYARHLGEPGTQLVADWKVPLSPGMHRALGALESVAADVARSVWVVARPAARLLAHATRGGRGTWPILPVPANHVEERFGLERSRRLLRIVQLRKVLIDVPNVWQGRTVRIHALRVRTGREIKLAALPGQPPLGSGDLPAQLQRALRMIGEAAFDAARMCITEEGGRLTDLPSLRAARDIEYEHEESTGEYGDVPVSVGRALEVRKLPVLPLLT